MMLRLALAAIMVVSITGVVALTGIVPTSAQSAPSATRSFDSTSVAPGGQVVVTIQATDYGQAGGVTETLPTGFSYVSSSLSASQVNESGQNVRFTLQGDTSFTYTVTASSTPGPYDFSGTLRDFERDDYPVGGATEVTVLTAGASTPPAATQPAATQPASPTQMATPDPEPVAPLPPDTGSGLALSPSTGIAAVLALLVLSGLLGALGATRRWLR